ncbi:hypothetical protein PLICRDRAFT_35269 [Plicaturopsis crispa FD-325 SS-3]|nr:hypothetical protein PLICRDRAFT_35269 [Plicaturopsis crispa FD-325 SS-3]
MHSSSSTSSCGSVHRPSSRSTSTTPCTPLAFALPVSARHTTSDAQPCVNHGAPQCCHCGWRGSHSPNCPFK